VPIPRDLNEHDLVAGWISEEAFARQRGLSIHSLRAERRRADGPPFTRDGLKISTAYKGFGIGSRGKARPASAEAIHPDRASKPNAASALR
jgi:hypothetical protein